MKVFGKFKQPPKDPTVTVFAYDYAFYTYNACRYVLSHPEEFPTEAVCSCRRELREMENSEVFMQVYYASLEKYEEVGL